MDGTRSRPLVRGRVPLGATPIVQYVQEGKVGAGEFKRRWESGGLTGGADLAKLGHFGHARPVRLRLPRHADRSAVWGNER